MVQSLRCHTTAEQQVCIPLSGGSSPRVDTCRPLSRERRVGGQPMVLSLFITQRCHQQGKGKGALPDQPAPSFTEGKRGKDSQEQFLLAVLSGSAGFCTPSATSESSQSGSAAASLVLWLLSAADTQPKLPSFDPTTCTLMQSACHAWSYLLASTDLFLPVTAGTERVRAQFNRVHLHC